MSDALANAYALKQHQVGSGFPYSPDQRGADGSSTCCDDGSGWKDAVTGLAGSRSLDHELHRRFCEWERRRFPVSLAIVSVDCPGSDGNDKLVHQIAGILANDVRKMDLLARCEDGCFYIVLPDTTICGARQAIRRLRGRLIELAHDFSASLGFGAASAVPSDSEFTLKVRAIEALEASRIAGGDSVRFHDGKRIVESVAETAIERQVSLARRMESVGRLAAGVAHEINTPIQFISNNVQFLQDSMQHFADWTKSCDELLNKSHSSGPPEVERLAALIAELDREALTREIPSAISETLGGLEHVKRIVSTMKDLAHPGAEKMVAVDVHRVIEGMINVSAGEWKQVARVVTDFDDSLEDIRAYPGELGQAILNLLVNAAHAVADVVASDPNRPGRIVVATRRMPTFIEIRISDNGPGIPEAVREMIFDPCFTTKPYGTGTGQGLSIARAAIVNKHGGAIELESEEGAGATFVIRLPLVEGREHDQEANPVRR